MWRPQDILTFCLQLLLTFGVWPKFRVKMSVCSSFPSFLFVPPCHISKIQFQKKCKYVSKLSCTLHSYAVFIQKSMKQQWLQFCNKYLLIINLILKGYKIQLEQWLISNRPISPHIKTFLKQELDTILSSF